VEGSTLQLLGFTPLTPGKYPRRFSKEWFSNIRLIKIR
jgi:hypothetical protein